MARCQAREASSSWRMLSPASGRPNSSEKMSDETVSQIGPEVQSRGRTGREKSANGQILTNPIAESRSTTNRLRSAHRCEFG